ncbi:MAG: hypothetical protein ABEJ88_06385 [Halobacterium sp.]
MFALTELRAVLHELRAIFRDAGTWLAWFVLTGQLSHDKTYGDLRRLTPKTLAAHLAPMALVLGTVGHFWFNTPPGFEYYILAALGVGIGTLGLLVTISFVASRVVDVSLTYA